MNRSTAYVTVVLAVEYTSEEGGDPSVGIPNGYLVEVDHVSYEYRKYDPQTGKTPFKYVEIPDIPDEMREDLEEQIAVDLEGGDA